ncbi:aminoglycoside phosphotransferase family protein [Streptomyces sp. NPDC050448]|uniref:aminoglycoside phosphotransferase family protein n=1 Tax=Streptomyces sp. NPDC050448 TaxID=3155404 RepID=UPI0034495CD5
MLGWCDELPALVGELAARWNLDLVAADGGGTSRVFRCFSHTGTPVWLKLTPEPGIAREEAEALRAWAQTPSVVTLLAHDLAAGALLLEDVEPGVPVRQLSWDLPEVAALLRNLRTSPPVPGKHSVVQPLSHRIDFLFDLTDRKVAAAGMNAPMASAVLGRGRAAALDLAASGPVGLVHGDLHPANVLSGPSARMVAIDPRPAWGDPDFDAVDWVLEGVTGLAVLEQRIEKLAALVPGQSPQRVLGWCRALAALIAVPRMCAGRGDAETRFLMTLAGG